METMYKHPQREAGESGGTEQRGSLGRSGRKRWWGREKPVLLSLDGRQGGTWHPASCGKSEHFTPQQFTVASCHCRLDPGSPWPHEVTLSRFCFQCVPCGGPGRSASPPAQLVMGGNSPCDPQPSPELTAVLRARSGRGSLTLITLGLLFINYIHSYPCLLVKFSSPL